MAGTSLIFLHRNKFNPIGKSPDDPQFISVNMLQYFSLHDEFPAHSQTWPEEHNYETLSPPCLDTAMVQDLQTNNQRNCGSHQRSAQSTISSDDTSTGQPYHESSCYCDCCLLRYLSECMGCDFSALPQDLMPSKLSDPTCADIKFNDDAETLWSAPSKATVISGPGSGMQAMQTDPFLTSDIGRWTPETCGYLAPDLQSVDDYLVSPINDYVVSPVDESGSRISLLELQIAGLADQRPLRPQTRRSATKTATVKTEGYTSIDKQTKNRTKKTGARQAHSVIERKYRDNLNERIHELHHTLQKAQHSTCVTESPRSNSSASSRGSGVDQDDMDDAKQASPKAKKSDVLVDAINYIQATKLEARCKVEEVQKLNLRIQMMESWLGNNTIN